MNDKKVTDKIKALYSEFQVPELKDLDKLGNIDRSSKKLGFYRKSAKRSSMANKIKICAPIAAVLIVAIFIGALNLSPAFAEYMMNSVPIIDSLANKFNWRVNKGLSLTADKGYLEELNVYDENNGVKFILEKYIIDKTGLVFFYSFEKDGEKIENPSELHFMLNDDKGNWLMGPHGIGDFFVGYGAEKFDFTEIIHRKRMNNDNSDFVLPDKFILTAIEGKSTNVSDPIAGAENVWEVEIPVDREKVNKSERRIIMNKTVEIGGQKILFKEATLYPTIAVVDVFYDDANTMNIFEIEDVVLADETGTIWRQIYDRNYDDLWFGYDGKYLDLQPNQRRLFFETPLFNEPKELTIKATGIRAIDKEKKIVIDPVNQILLEAPDDNLELKGVSIDDNLVLDFKLSLRRKYDDPNYEEAESQYYVSFDPSSSFTSDHERSKDFILDKGTDAEGVPLKFYRCERRRNKPDGYMNMKYEFKFDKPLTGPLTFDIRDYRNWIKEDIEVPIIP